MNNDDIASVLSTVDMFTGLSPKVLMRIAASGRVVESPPEAELVRAGEPVSGFRAVSPDGVEIHVILTGTAIVQVNGKVVRTLVADDYLPRGGKRLLTRVYRRTSLRRLTVYPGGRVPSLSIRMGQRLHRGLSEQHFFLGRGMPQFYSM